MALLDASQRSRLSALLESVGLMVTERPASIFSARNLEADLAKVIKVPKGGGSTIGTQRCRGVEGRKELRSRLEVSSYSGGSIQSLRTRYSVSYHSYSPVILSRPYPCVSALSPVCLTRRKMLDPV